MRLPNRKLSFVAIFAFFSPFAGAVSAQSNGVQPLIKQPVNESPLVTLTGNTHPLARAAFDRGAAPGSLTMDHMLLLLRRSPQQGAAVNKLMAEQQDKSSPNYHQWLTAAQFGAQFGPADVDIQSVTSWLASHGFQVNRVSNGRTVIDFSGTAAQVQSAFHTTIHHYVLPNGEQHWANSSDPEIPAALAPVVAGIRSLHNFFPKFAHHAAAHPAFTFPLTDCNPSVNSCFVVTPADLSTIYSVPATVSGKTGGTGVVIAIVADSDIHPTDLTQFRSLFGLTAMTIAGSASQCQPASPTCFLIFIPPGQTDPGVVGDGGEPEAVLDSEWSGAPAPGANIWLVSSADTTTTFGAELSATYIVDCPTTGPGCPTAVPASVLTASFSTCEFELGTSGNQFYNSLWQQAALEGITAVVATGDSGSAGCDFFDPSFGTPQPAEGGLAVSGVASTPYDVAVGGTDFNEAGLTSATNPLNFWNASNTGTASAKGYIPETSWNDSCTNSIFVSLNDGPNAQSNCDNPSLSDFIFTVGGGGGPSSCTVSNFNPQTNTGSLSSCSTPYPKPSWQTGTTISDGVRDIPDVSLFASNGFLGSIYVVCQADADPQALEVNPTCSLANPPTSFSSPASFGEVGGTSVSAQVFGGIVALIDQKTGFSQGNISPILYSLAGEAGDTCPSAANPASTCMFYDVTSGTISQPCDISLPGFVASPNCVGNSGAEIGVLETGGQLAYNAAAGYDLTTGLGSVNAGNLVNKWPAAPDFVLTSTNPIVIIPNASGSGSFSVSVASENGLSGTITFSSCSGLPAGFQCMLPANTNLAAGATVTGTVTVEPLSSGMVIPVTLPGTWSRNRGFAAFALYCTPILVLLLLRSGRHVRFRWTAIAGVVLLGVLTWSGCGGGGSGGGGGGGTTTATVTVTVGAQSHSLNFQVTVE
jgi:subtilase family serine protease